MTYENKLTEQVKLRKTAEAKLSLSPKPRPRPPEILLHELHVHQIELEMQNEQLRQSQIALEKSRDRYFNFYNFAPVGYLTLNNNGMIDEVNLTGATLLGVERNKLPHRRFISYIATEYQDLWYRHFMRVQNQDNSLACELVLKRGDSSTFHAQLDCLRVKDDDASTVVRVVLTDITERKNADQIVNKLAFYDSLTQLPNRRLLDDRLDQAIAACKRSGLYGAVLFLDLDNFKPLNDKHGHKAGDLLLVEVARRLAGCVREVDTVARFGGDEFVVVLSELDVDQSDSAAQAKIIGDKIHTALSGEYWLTSTAHGSTKMIIHHNVGASIGVALFGNNDHPVNILKWADIAMYQAKAAGRNTIRFYELKF